MQHSQSPEEAMGRHGDVSQPYMFGTAYWSILLTLSNSCSAVERAEKVAQRMAIVRFGFNRVTLTKRRSLPLYPDKQTFSESVGMSQRCQ
jgi:hypothetical protein